MRRVGSLRRSVRILRPNGCSRPSTCRSGVRPALDVFLAAIRNGMEEDRRSAREAMLKLFAVLGDDDPLTQEYRRRLASALF